MTIYTQEEINDFKEYLSYSVKEGFLDEFEAEEIQSNENWSLVEEMIARGDACANDNEMEAGD